MTDNPTLAAGEKRTVLDVLRRAQDRYLTDAEFHAVVYLAVRAAAPIASDAAEAATMAASVALILVEDGAR